MISGHPDTDRTILSNLNDRDMLSLCTTNKYFNSKVCNETFFRSRLISTYPNLQISPESEKVKNWRELYLEIVMYEDKLRTDFGFIYSHNTKEGSPKFYYDFIKYFDINIHHGLKEAALYKNHPLIDYYLSKGAYVDFGLFGAVSVKDKMLVQYFIDKGASQFLSAFKEAVRVGSKELVDFFISKEINSWNVGLEEAVKYKRYELVDFFINKGANIGSYGIPTAERNNDKKMADYLKGKL